MPSRLSNDDYYLSLLPGVAARGTCQRRLVGAIIVDGDKRVLSMGFNGPPKGFPHCGELRRIDVSTHSMRDQFVLAAEQSPVACLGFDDPKGDTSRCMAVHAEINALLTCSELRHARKMYVSCSPCRNCALAIANTEIRHVVCLELYADDARHILEAAGIKLEVRERPPESGNQLPGEPTSCTDPQLHESVGHTAACWGK